MLVAMPEIPSRREPTNCAILPQFSWPARLCSCSGPTPYFVSRLVAAVT